VLYSSFIKLKIESYSPTNSRFLAVSH